MSGPTSRALCCVVTRDHCPFLIACYRSVLARNAGIPLYALVVDVEPGETAALSALLESCLPAQARHRIRVLGLDDVAPGATESLRFYYDAFELCTAGKAFLLDWMHASADIAAWLYLDSDILCFAELDALFDCLTEGCDILLTSHAGGHTDGLARDLEFLTAGCFNAGVIGLRRTPESRRFAGWFRAVLTHLALNDFPLPAAERFVQQTVLYADQRWLDLVPGYFDGVFAARRRGFNLGHWNVGDDRLRRVGGDLYAGDDKVWLLHLSGWSPDDATRFCRYTPHDFAADDAWVEICTRYRDEILALRGRFGAGYRYASYADGTPIPKAHRRAYLQRLLNGDEPLPSPFTMREHFEQFAPFRRRLVWDRTTVLPPRRA